MTVMMLDGDGDEQRREDCGTQPEVSCSPLASVCACDWAGLRHCAGLCSAVQDCAMCRPRQDKGAKTDLCGPFYMYFT